MPQGPLPLVLWALTFFISTSETCSLRSRITAVEGEPFYLKYCSPFKNEETPAPVKWYKSNASHGRVELSSSSAPRIEMYDYVLEFWPIELEDVGSYCLQTGNDTREWTVNVTRRSKHSCFAEKLVNSKEVEVRNALRISCKHGYYQKRVNRTLLYKNCEKVKDNKTPPLQKNAEFEDQGYYTCVFFLHHNGKLFNVTNTLKITVVGDHSSVMPVLLGPKLNRVGVDLGTDVQLNCSAVLNEKDVIYWNFWKENGEDPNVHEEEEIRIKTPEGKWHASKILRIENVGENNLNFLYNCSAVSEAGTDTNSFVLLRKEDLVDIPSHVFTRGMVTAVLVSVAVVGLVTLGVAHRVDLALFYRRFTGRDETLTDGKTYDAFVSYLKDCPAGHGDEHAFAVETLPAVLEKHFGYKLCIFERDVVPGGAVVDEIHSLIEKSRRLIIVLSPGYVSNAVRYELESGLHEALVGRKIKVILIEFTPLSDFTFLPQSLKLLKSHRVLKWKAEKSVSYNSRFWKNLLYLMPAKSAVRPCRGELEALDVLPES